MRYELERKVSTTGASGFCSTTAVTLTSKEASASHCDGAKEGSIQIRKNETKCSGDRRETDLTGLKL